MLSQPKRSRRASRIASQVDEGYLLNDQTWVANVPKSLCHRYDRRTQTAVLGGYNPTSHGFTSALLVGSWLDLDLFEISHLYDERARIETEIKAARGGLRLPKRRKQQFEAQEALVLLTDWAHHMLAWRRDFGAAEAQIGDLGISGMINQSMMIPGKLTFDEGQLVKARLQATPPLAKPVISSLSRLLRDF